MNHPASLHPGAAVDVFVPASAANLGPGFDSFGLALGVIDSYRMQVRDEPGLVVDLGVNGQGVPTDERHLVVASMMRAWRELGIAAPAGLSLTCRNVVRMGRGMGSSAAAIVAGVAAAQALASPSAQPGSPDGTSVELDLEFVNDLASALEGHPDNASASVYGAATLSWVDSQSARVDGDTLHRVHSERLDVHPDIEPVVLVPQIQLSTSTARAVLPEQVPHEIAALNSARAALLVLALTARPELLLPATREWLHQEQRRVSLGGAMELVDTLRSAGFAAVISGAGPSVLVLTTCDRAGEVAPLVPESWSVLRPGIPDGGVHVSRATLAMPLKESTTIC
ncbi:homoserine kinase [Gephyromycinifex aptenodytis]|uniref:homoserine kinase n=1 Tax=Gephyromycinifex aptenodytis TaxID=2716227 RepID=UPI0014453E1B|nr:homoserine kinase [Gephyromycinifex aptenodytis]